MPSRYDFRIVCPQINMPAAISKKNTPNQRRRTSAGWGGIAGSYHVAMALPSGKITPASALNQANQPQVCSRMVAADVRLRILARKPLPPRYPAATALTTILELAL